MTAAVAAAHAGGGPRRFMAPPRSEVAAAVFEQPLFAGIATYRDLLVGAHWPTVAAMNERLALPGLQLVEQDAALLADGLHYEARIAQGRLATRARNWHDLFNALVWACYPQLKRGLNRQQCQHIATMPPGQRNRAQAALTQFDETGVVVRVRDTALIAAWDAHDWRSVFDARSWQAGDIGIAAVFGHALMEQALLPARLLVGKCLVVRGDDDAECIETAAQAVEVGRALTDPLQLRPLPLAGIAGWHADQSHAAFCANEDYFRPLRAGREYPPPL